MKANLLSLHAFFPIHSHDDTMELSVRTALKQGKLFNDIGPCLYRFYHYVFAMGPRQEWKEGNVPLRKIVMS